MLAPGQRIDRYELLSPIGDGGMAHVWAARQHGKHGFEKLCALKIIHSRYAEDASFRAMFLDEARIVAGIQHRNVVRVFDLGESGSLLYIVMEYVDGDSLFALLSNDKTVPVPIALRIAADACAGLHAAHMLTDAAGRPRNVVHRDVSPQNILVASSGDAKVIDFGIAHARDRVAGPTAAGMVKGKIRYMAPEQARGEPLGAFTDVFGVGAVLFRMLAGRPPYTAESNTATMQALIANAPPTSNLPPAVPPDVAAIVHRAIATEPRARFATAREMQAALEAVLARESRPSDVAAWVEANLGDRARERRRALAEGRAVPASADAIAMALLPHVAPPAFGSPFPTTAPGTPVPSNVTPAAIAAPAAAPPPLAFPGAPPPPAPVIAAPPPTLALPAAPAQPSEPAPLEERSFMDVQALVAKAQQGGAGQSRGNGAPPPPKAPLAKEPPATAAKQAQPRRYVGPATPAGETLGARSRKVLIAIPVVAIVLLVVGTVLLLPMFVRNRAIAQAREAGLDVTIEHVSVGLRCTALRGVKAKVVRTPGITATIPEVCLAGLSGKNARIHDMEVKMTGDRADIEDGLAALVADNRVRWAGTRDAPRHLSIVGARVVWEGVAGAGSRLSAADVGVEIESRGPGAEEVRGTVGRFELSTERTTFGPWACSFETAGGTSRLRVMFDPPVPDGPSMIFVWGQTIPREVSINIPRSPFANLGIQPKSFGLPADASTEVEVKLQGKLPSEGRSEVKGEVGLWGLRPAGLGGALDVRAEGSAAGQAGKPLELQRTTVTVGPFVAGVTGTIALHDSGVRVDAMFKTLPLTCAALARAEAKKLGPLVQTLQAIGQSTGALRVVGNVNVSGVVTYDTASPEDASVTWTAKETCGVSIFGL
jgi:serine/threonine-protein kinase